MQHGQKVTALRPSWGIDVNAGQKGNEEEMYSNTVTNY